MGCRGRDCYRPRERRQKRERRAQVRAEAIERYGGKCADCGETDPTKLTFHHVNGGGSEQRRIYRHESTALTLQKLGWPTDIVALCWPCHRERDGERIRDGSRKGALATQITWLERELRLGE